MRLRTALAAGLMTLASMAFSATWNVPGDFPTIQQAINAAAPGDTIQVAAGVYAESLTVNKQLIIQGAGNTTIINGGNAPGVIYTAGGVNAANRQVLRNLQVQSNVDNIGVRDSGSHFTFDRLLVQHTGTQNPAASQLHGISFTSPSGTASPWTTGTAKVHGDVIISNSVFKDHYYAVKVMEDMTDLRISNTQFLGGWYGFFLWNGNTAGSANSVGPVTNRTTNNILIDNCLFYDQGTKGIYAERGNNLTIQNTGVYYAGNRSGRSLPTTDPRGLDLTGNSNVGNGIDINLCGSGPVQNIVFRNVTVAYCAIRDREVTSDPLAPGQANAVGIGSGVSIKGRMHRGGSSITGLYITNSNFVNNKIGLAFPQVDIQNNVAPGNPGTIGVDKGNVIYNAHVVNNNIYGNRTRAINPESTAFPNSSSLVFGSPLNVAVINGYPTTGTWDSTGMQPINMSGNYFGSLSGPGAVPTSVTPYAGSGDRLTDGVNLIGFVGGRIATSNGRPVDLTGTYTGPSSGPLGAGSAPGRAAASTGLSILGSLTFEMSGTNTVSYNAVPGSFQPFAEDTNKAPRLLNLPKPVGETTLTSVVTLNDPANWNPWRWGGQHGATHATGDTFVVGISNVYNAAGVQFVRDYLSGDFRARMASENFATRTTFGDGTAVLGSLAGNDATSPVMPGSTQFQVTIVVRGNSLEGWVTPVDGTLAGQAQYLGTISKTNMNTNSPWTIVVDDTSPFPGVNTHYAAGFVTYQTDNSLAHATVESFRSSQDDNVFSTWANDPYVRGAELIQYVLGSSNLTLAAYGYQGSFGFTGAGTVSSFSVEPYPFPQVLLAPTTGALHYAAGVATNVPGPQFDTILGRLNMVNPGGNGTATLSPLSTFFGTLPARYADVNGDPFPSLTRVESNVVVIDNINPTLAAQSLTLAPSTSIPINGSGTLISGSYRLVVSAADLGASRSGLHDRPTYTIDFGNDNSIEIGPTQMNSGTGNDFFADFAVANNVTNGTAKMTLYVRDRAGNESTQEIFFTVNTTTVTINFNVPSGWQGQALWVHVRLGGDGTGTNAPLDYHRSVTIGSGGAGQLVLNALNTSGSTLLPQAPNNLTQYSVKVMPYSLRRNGSLTGSIDKVGTAGTVRFGDANGDNIVDILDYAFYAVAYNTTETPAPVGQVDGTAPPADGVSLPINFRRSDFSGNGLVFTEDFTFFFPFPAVGELLSSGPGNYLPNPRPRLQITVREAVANGIPHNIAIAMDINRDGIITVQEIDEYLKRGARR
jgi:hypothetical protein